MSKRSRFLLQWIGWLLPAVAIITAVVYSSVSFQDSPAAIPAETPPSTAATIPVPTTLPPAETAESLSDHEEKMLHLLLIGRDSQEDAACSRSDVMILCTLQPARGKILLTSFLRDLYVPIPGHGSDRLNAAYAYGGMALLRQTMEENFALELDGCVEVDFSGFVQIIDDLGGVTMDLRSDEAAVINRKTPGTLTGGTQTLNGQQALAYARIRKLDTDGDFSRTNRQRKLLVALWSSLRDAGTRELLSAMGNILAVVSTDMESPELVPTALRLLPLLRDCEIVSSQIPPEGTFEYTTIRGMAVLTADMDKLRQALSQILEDGA